MHAVKLCVNSSNRASDINRPRRSRRSRVLNQLPDVMNLERPAYFPLLDPSCRTERIVCIYADVEGVFAPIPTIFRVARGLRFENSRGVPT